MKLQAVKGTNDLLPDQQAAWQRVIGAAATVLGRAGAGRITTPVFEYSEVFTKTAGTSADLVVQKEMYTFEDRGGRSLTLRPEFTASVMRAYLEHGMPTLPTPVKLWSAGPLFRAENVQRGRSRQFHQVNLEIVGLASPLADAEAIDLLYRWLASCGLEGHVVRLGSVGDPEDRRAYNAYLREAMAARADDLSEVGRERLRLNPMRLLDSKDASDKELIADLKRPLDLLGPAAREHLSEVRRHLEAWGVPYELDPGIVRGLDYYRRTAFEVHMGNIGAQSAIGGGGRYDGLVEVMGGPPTPAVGWAVGIERLLDALPDEATTTRTTTGPAVFLVPLDDEAVAEVAGLASELRAAMHVEFAYARRNVGKGLKDADRRGAVFAGLRGEAERRSGVLLLKHLATGEQHEVALEEVASFVSGRLALIGSRS